MTAVLQQPAAPTQVAPLRSLIDSKYGQATYSIANTIWTAASGSPALAQTVKSVIAAGILAKNKLPAAMERSIDEKLTTAYSLVDSEENFNKTIDQLDTTFDEKLEEVKTRIEGTIGGAKAQLNDTKATINNKLNETVNTAKTQVTESLAAVDQNEHVNRVVDFVCTLEPTVLTVVNYVLPEDETENSKEMEEEEDFEDASEDGKPEEYALKKTMRLTGNVTKRVSKSVQKRWLVASLQLEKQKQHINTRTDSVRKVISDNSVDLIAYSMSINENCSKLTGTIYESYVVQAEKAEAFAKSIPTIGINAMGTVIPTLIPAAIAGINIDFKALEFDLSLASVQSGASELAAVMSQSKELYINGALENASQRLDATTTLIRTRSSEQLQRIGELSAVQIDRYGPVVAPIVGPVVAPLGPFIIQVTSKIALVFGVELNKEQLQNHPVVLKLLLFSEGKNAVGDSDGDARPTQQDAKLENANVESLKEINTCKKS